MIYNENRPKSGALARNPGYYLEIRASSSAQGEGAKTNLVRKGNATYYLIALSQCEIEKNTHHVADVRGFRKLSPTHTFLPRRVFNTLRTLTSALLLLGTPPSFFMPSICLMLSAHIAHTMFIASRARRVR